jgi:hypothetical protein
VCRSFVSRWKPGARKELEGEVGRELVLRVAVESDEVLRGIGHCRQPAVLQDFCRCAMPALSAVP